MCARDNDFWVFGYGSLMWRPGFDYVEAHPALLRGYHRALCVRSVVYRGTPERPGLVLGLERGGSCRGRAFRIADERVDHVVKYLDDREQIHGVYAPKYLTVTLDDGRRVKAYLFVARRDHVQYAGRLSPEDCAERLLRGHGKSGSGLDYLRKTVRHLDDLGIADGPLHEILAIAEAKERS